jgi:hypothetical protein
LRTPVVPAQRRPGSRTLAHLLAEHERISLEVINAGRKPAEDRRIQDLEAEIAKHTAQYL